MKDKEEIKLLKRYNKLSGLVNGGNFRTRNSYNKAYKNLSFQYTYENYVNNRLINICLNIEHSKVIQISEEVRELIKSTDKSCAIIAANIIYNENKFRWKKK